MILTAAIVHLLFQSKTPIPRRYSDIPNNRNQDSVSKTDGEAVYYTRERIDVLVGTLIILAILVLLVVPIYLLLHLTIGAETTHSNAVCIGILLISTLLFSACISAFTSKISRPRTVNETLTESQGQEDMRFSVLPLRACLPSILLRTGSAASCC